MYPLSLTPRSGPFGPGILLAAAFLWGLAGCEREPDIATYEARLDPTPPPVSVTNSGAGVALGMGNTATPVEAGPALIAWDLPEGWTDTGTSNQFRVSTFVAGEDADRVEVAVSRVPGEAGRMTDNVNRWRGQLGLDPLTPDQVVAEVDYAGHESLPAFITDQANDGRRFLIAWFPFDHESWFFKADGTPGAIDLHREGFETLIMSVRMNAAAAEDTTAQIEAEEPAHNHASHDGQDHD